MTTPVLSVETSALRLATKADLEEIARFNLTDGPFPESTLQKLIELSVANHLTDIGAICDYDVTFGASSLTYEQLNQLGNQLAHLLIAEGVKSGDIVGLMVERSFAMIIGILGIIKAGAAYLPLSATDARERIHFMLHDASVRTLLVQNATAGKIGFEGLTLNLDSAYIYSGPVTNPVIVNTPRDLAYVIYTSGSTGKPKGVMIEHRSVVNRLHWMQRCYPIDKRDVILQKTPHYFDVSVWELFWWILYGAKLCFLLPGAQWNPMAIIKTVKKHQITVMHFVPSMLNVFLEYLDSKGPNGLPGLRSVRRVFASGEALMPALVKKFNEIWNSQTGALLTNLYGPTEATIDVSYFDCPISNDFDKIPIGKPIQNHKFYILKDNDHVAIGEIGELCVEGIGLARGYLNNPDLTNQKFTDNPANPGERIYRTGDLARWLPDGNVEYLGREDHQVKIRGMRIELSEIENQIKSYPGISDCIAIVKTYSENISLIVAYVMTASELEIDSLKQYLADYLPDYMIPNHFQKLDAIPLTPSGKANRRALPEPILVR